MSAALSNVTHLASVKLPDPLVPSDCDLRGMPGMMVDTSRLPRSQLRLKCSADEFRAAIILWCAAWSELPASSLPDDDEELAKLAGESRTRWKRIRGEAMRGWIKCSDGRFYHPVLASKARDAWKARTKQRDRANSRWHPEQKPAKTEEQTGKNAEDFQKSSEDSVAEASKVKDLLDAAALQENGKGKGKDKKKSPRTPRKTGGRARARPYTADFELFWAEYPKAARDDMPGSFDEWEDALAAGVTPQQIFDALEEYKTGKWANCDPRWINAPRNWLKKDPWRNRSVLDDTPNPTPLDNLSTSCNTKPAEYKPADLFGG